MTYKTAGVHILSLPFFADRLFEYYVPSELADDICLGSFVVVPFGGSNKRMNAVVYAFSERDDVSQLKPIESVNTELTMTDEELRLTLFVKEHCFCSTADVIKQMIPAEAITKLTTVYRALPYSKSFPPINKNSMEVYEELLKHGDKSVEQLVAKYGDSVQKLLPRLFRLGWLERVPLDKKSRNTVTKECYSLSLSVKNVNDVLVSLKGKKQRAIFETLVSLGSADGDSLRSMHGALHPSIDPLIERGYVTLEKKEVYRDPYFGIAPEKRPSFELSEAQKQAYDRLAELVDSDMPRAALLHGVTGSGKTMVIKALIDKVIAKGRRVIMLVPEIALTPQTVSFFASFYGERIAVIHSGLSRGERFDAWRRIKSGEVDLCIGTRSAVFAPLDKLGMIVIDEEHEHTYKSDQAPKYHARDVARFRCADHSALMLLASATPSVESYYRAKQGIYTLVELGERYNNARLPETLICDMRVDAAAGKLSPIGTLLTDAVGRTLEKGEQSILFVNRRGYNNYLSCPLCGKVLTCPHCSVSLTYHTSGVQHMHRADAEKREGYLVCHYCGHREPPPRVCPDCGSDKFTHMGFGTQKAEDELSSLFPNAKTTRLDADTASAKFSSDKLLDGFRRHESDILIGTQMVTKGHNFPDVTLVGVLSADDSLYVSDYRAGERTFALITQVIGRAGRGEKPGVAIIQTYSPDHPILLEAAAQNYAEFYENEIAMRRSLVFPPFCDIALILMTCADETLLTNTAAAFAKRVGELASGDFSDVPLELFGPLEAPVYKMNENYRMRFIAKCRSNKRTRALFTMLMSEFTRGAGKKVTFTVDMNPSSV